MAFATAKRHAKPSAAHIANAFRNVFRKILFRLGATLGTHHPETIVPRGNQLLGCGLGKQIASKVFDRHSVERFTAIERIDHIIAKGGYGNWLVTVVSHAVRIPNEIQPPNGHAFTVLRRPDQVVDQFFVRLIAGVGLEALDPFGFRW